MICAPDCSFDDEKDVRDAILELIEEIEQDEDLDYEAMMSVGNLHIDVLHDPFSGETLRELCQVFTGADEMDEDYWNIVNEVYLRLLAVRDGKGPDWDREELAIERICLDKPVGFEKWLRAHKTLDIFQVGDEILLQRFEAYQNNMKFRIFCRLADTRLLPDDEEEFGEYVEATFRQLVEDNLENKSDDWMPERSELLESWKNDSNNRPTKIRK